MEKFVSGIRDGKKSDPGSELQYKYPGSAKLVRSVVVICSSGMLVVMSLGGEICLYSIDALLSQRAGKPSDLSASHKQEFPLTVQVEYRPAPRPQC